MSLIEVERLSVALGKKPRHTIISNISLELNSGELIAVVGPSGSGKSTLFNTIIGLVEKSGGALKCTDDIGYIPANTILYDDLSVKQTMHYTAKLRMKASNQQIKAKISDVLGELDLLPLINRKVKNLSTGERKRLSVATELLTSPKVLLLDEPTSGLDPTLDVIIMKLLRKLADNGQGIIIITHNLAFVNEYCDKVLILSKLGEPVYYDKTSMIKDIIGTWSWSRIFDWISNNPEEGGDFYRKCHPNPQF